MPSDTPSDLQVRLIRNALILSVVQLAATLLLLFLILRVGAPWLVSEHNTPALWLAGLLLLACPLILIQAVYGLWRCWAPVRARSSRRTLTVL
jgi:hypothetical protein